MQRRMGAPERDMASFVLQCACPQTASRQSELGVGMCTLIHGTLTWRGTRRSTLPYSSCGHPDAAMPQCGVESCRKQRAQQSTKEWVTHQCVIVQRQPSQSLMLRAHAAALGCCGYYCWAASASTTGVHAGAAVNARANGSYRPTYRRGCGLSKPCGAPSPPQEWGTVDDATQPFQ